MASPLAWADVTEVVARDYIQQTWKADDGLPHPIIHQICQDKTGFLWLATAGGLARFDGREFKSYVPATAFQGGGLNVRAIAVEDETTMVAIVASGQVLRLRGDTFSVHPVSETVQPLSPIEMFAEPNGTIWIGAEHGLVRWSDGQTRVFGKADGIARRVPRYSFAIDSEGRTWVATGNFLAYYAEGKLVKSDAISASTLIVGRSAAGIWVVADRRLLKLENGAVSTIAETTPWKTDTVVRALCEDRNGDLWLAATNHGLFRCSAGELIPVRSPSETLNFIMEDRERNLWTCANGEGLSVLKPKSFLHFPPEKSGMSETVSTSVCDDASGRIWFANGKSGVVQRLVSDNLRPARHWTGIDACAVCPDREGNLWIGAAEGVFQIGRDEPAELRNMQVPIKMARVLFCSRNGDIWIGGNRTGLGVYRAGGFKLLVPTEGMSRERFSVFAEDQEGTVWTAGNSGRLYRIINDELVVVPPFDTSPRMPIHTLCVDRTGVLWVGSANGLFAKIGDSFQRLAQEDGLPDSMIFQLIEDNRGFLWFGSRRGLFYVAIESLRKRAAGQGGPVRALTFGKDEGLAGVLPDATTQPSVWKDRSGVLWFATYQGVIAVDPSALRPVPAPPPVLIDEVIIDGERVPPLGEVRVPPGQHHVEFRFSAVTFSAPSKVHLRHKLEGADPDWIETSSARAASYSGLAPGNYRMYVTASNENGVWNEQEAQLAIFVAPQWWQTTWFRVLAAALVIGLVAGVVRYWSGLKLRRKLERLEQEHALEKERARIARDVHDELGGSVTGVRFLVSRLKDESAALNRGAILEQLSGHTQRLAFDLERVVWSVSPHNNSLDGLASFVGKFAQNFLRSTSIECKIERRSEIPPVRLTPEVQHHILAVTKEAMNNVLKHSRATQVILETSYNDGVFELSIRDNGKGFVVDAPEHAERNGLGNMRSRIAEAGGTLTIRSTPDRGAEVHLSVPMASRPTRPPPPSVSTP